MTAVVYSSARFSAQNISGGPLGGGKLHTFQNGTEIEATTYSDSAGTVNANPVVLNERGEAVVYVNPMQVYTFVLRDGGGALIWSQDGITGAASSVDFGAFKQDLAAGLGSPDGYFIAEFPDAILRSALSKSRDTVSATDFPGVDSTGATSSTAGINAALASDATVILIPHGRYKLDGSINDPGGKVVYCDGVFAPVAAMGDLPVVALGSESRWYTPKIDMGQMASTLITDPKAQVGFYAKDARDVVVHDLEVFNIRWGRPAFITGTSSLTPAATDGSKNIDFINMRCLAFPSMTVDNGTFCVVSSDFYTGTNGGQCYAGSNGVNLSDYQKNESVSFPTTTENIRFINPKFANHDRFAVLNASNVMIQNPDWTGFYTRGLNVSPTCHNVWSRGGRIMGGSATLAGFAYACTDSGMTDVVIDASGSVGEKAALKAYFGCTGIEFTNISGVGSASAHVLMHSAKVKCTNVRLTPSTTGSTTFAIDVSGGPASGTGTFATTLEMIDCDLQSSFGVRMNINSGTETIAPGGIKFRNVTFRNSNQAYASVTNPPGILDWIGVKCLSAAASSIPLNMFVQNEQNDLPNTGVLKTGFRDSGFTMARLPSTFPVGVTTVLVDGDTGFPAATKQGIVVTYVLDASTGFEKFTTQTAYPANNDAATLADMYIRKGVNATTWSAWKKYTALDERTNDSK